MKRVYPCRGLIYPRKLPKTINPDSGYFLFLYEMNNSISFLITDFQERQEASSLQMSGSANPFRNEIWDEVWHLDSLSEAYQKLAEYQAEIEAKQ